MKNSKRDKKLDSLLGKKVEIIFDNQNAVKGRLGWQNFCAPDMGRKAFSYYIKKADGTCFSFRKSHVIYAREVRK